MILLSFAVQITYYVKWNIKENEKGKQCSHSFICPLMITECGQEKGIFFSEQNPLFSSQIISEILPQLSDAMKTRAKTYLGKLFTK